MKKNQTLILVSIACLALVSAIVFYFRPDNNANTAIAESTTSTPSVMAVSDSTPPNTSNQLGTTSTQNNHIQTIPIKMRAFVEEVESVLTGAQSRESKILSLLDILHNAESDEEKIATLQSLATLKPIEYADDLILLSQSNQESDEVRAEALNTLNKAYLLSDEEVEKIGGSTVYIQMEKVKQYVNTVINDKDNNPPKLYATALQGYVYMESDKALSLAKNIVEKSNNLTEAESNFFTETMFVDNHNLTSLLPILQQYPEKITDSMASQLAVMSADPIILEELSQAQKQQVITILKSHELDANDPMYQVELNTINAKVKDIENTL